MNHFTSRLMRPSPVLAAAAASAVALVCLSWSGSAAAQNTLGVDLSYNDTVGTDLGDTGAGIDLFFGPRMDLGLVALTTELDGGFHNFGGGLEPTVYRAMAGGRLALGAVIRPTAFAHIGVGHLRWDELGGRDGRTALTTDLGVALDFTLLPLVDFGVQLSYNAVAASSGEPAFEWAEAGAHVIFVFGS